MRNMKKVISCLLLIVATMAITMTAYASSGSDITFKEAGFNTVLGIGTVFIMLVVISLIIYCFRFIPMIQKAFTKKKDGAAEATKAEPVQKAAPVAVQEEDDLELIAVIAAAIAASEQIPLDSFVVRSIKRRA